MPLSQENEFQNLKSDRYWPDDGAEDFGDLTVELENEDPFDDYLVREFMVKPNHGEEGSEMKVLQYHYMGWPDHGVPVSSKALLEIMSSVKNHVKSVQVEGKPSPPIVVHCRFV